MMKKEFEALAGIFPSDELYKVIEAAYYDFTGDKTAFSATTRRKTARARARSRRATTSRIPGTQTPPASRRWTAMTAISRFRTTDGRPKADQLRAKDTRPQRGGDDRGMDPSTSDTQRSPQAVRRC